MKRKKAGLLPFVMLGIIAVLCLLAPLLPLPNPEAMNITKRFALPTLQEPFGMDEFGRSVMSRLIWGTRISLVIAVTSALAAAAIGTAFGVLAGYLRGLTETLVMRSVDVLLCLPTLLMAMLFVTLYGPGTATVIPVLAVVYAPTFTRVAYACVLSVRSMEYVEATETLGASRLRIMVRTILPNISGPMLVQLSLAAASAVVLESGLSFLGLGVVPPSPSLGGMIGAARSTMAHSVGLLVWPCIVLSIVTLTMYGTCDVLRDWLDPRGGRATEVLR
ncbi:ABC transporter permease [Bradyrhizobium sp. BWA-3-5]|uniref:ABC transporter permease n=1 Tax=Bradyrhizobium sp. BWA-3-5 TaxID=3080013 RepID=UPI00293E500B|nr:ABC transporter permease [Bradyrhizobium sp. BWA-3-5]WOH63732.1 ABC transporter permease [Bradyrhizobium sp. BWA-3-5]